MRKVLFSLFGVIACIVTLAAAVPVRQSFAGGQYPGWRRGGELLQITAREKAVELQASELSFARLIRPLALTPGRSYKIVLQGSGPLDVRIRRPGEGARNDLDLRDVFAKSPVCEFIYTPPAEYRANVRLMLCPAERNVPARVERFELIPLGEAPAQAGVREATLRHAARPPKVRGFAFTDGQVTPERIRKAKALHGNFFRVRLPEAGDLAGAREACLLARKWNVQITLEFMEGGAELVQSPAFARLLEEFRQEIWAVRPAKKATEDLAAMFRKKFPEVLFLQELEHCRVSELLDDSKIVCSFRVGDPGALRKLKQLRVRYPVPVLVTVPAEMARAAEGENWPFAVETCDAELARDGAMAERALVKNAPAEERQASLVRAVQQVRKPDSLVFAFITDTHYQIRPPFSVSPFNYCYPEVLQTMQTMADLARRVKADFVGHGGDVIDGLNPRHHLAEDLQTVMKTLQRSGAPVLMAKGNHDDGSLWCFRHKKGAPEDILTQQDWFRIVARNALASGAVGDPARPDAGYFYMDFPAARVRVIILNCSENPHAVGSDGKLKFNSIGITDIGAGQLRWLAEKALDFRDKKDRRKWGVLLISHVDFGMDTACNARNLQGVLAAFLDGGKYAGESYPGVCGVDTGKVACDFSAQGPMRIYGGLFGHNHRFNHYDAYLFGGRMLDLGFPSALTPRKSLGTADEGSFALCVLDPGGKKMHVFRYGQGGDGVFPLEMSADGALEK